MIPAEYRAIAERERAKAVAAALTGLGHSLGKLFTNQSKVHM